MKPGETHWFGGWLTGTETPADITNIKACIEAEVGEVCHNLRVLHSPFKWSEARIGDDHVPPVPDGVHGPDVRFLVVETTIVGRMPYLSTSNRSFIGDLDKKDLERLREITRKAHAKHHRGRRLTDMECDDIIDAIGPDAALDAMRQDTVH